MSEEPKPLVEDIPRTQEDDDTWAFTTKKTKKGKKGKNGSGTMTPMNEPDLALQPESTETMSYLVEALPSSEPSTEPVPGTEEPGPAGEGISHLPEDDDAWTFTTKKSKKGKRGKKGSGVATPANEPEPPVESEITEDAREVTKETRDIEPMVEPVTEQGNARAPESPRAHSGRRSAR